jgi:hypothetical protein
MWISDDSLQWRVYVGQRRQCPVSGSCGSVTTVSSGGLMWVSDDSVQWRAYVVRLQKFSLVSRSLFYPVAGSSDHDNDPSG